VDVKPLPLPEIDSAASWVAAHLAGLFTDEPTPSARFTGGQQAADAALGAFDVTGYAVKRNEVLPAESRGASYLSPYIRHGLLPLRTVWEAVADGPARDVAKFRDELLWQEYARHLYARLGNATALPLRFSSSPTTASLDPWPDEMACVATMVDELEKDGWVVNQARMWLASQWAVRSGSDWRAGEDRFFKHLLDGSRAANRLGWQWTSGLQTGKQHGFSRRQVERRAPELCDACPLAENCPIEGWPATATPDPVEADPRLRSDPKLAATRGPLAPYRAQEPDVVWLTAESLGDSDPALAANPELPVIFVFDEPLLRSLQLSAKRPIFLTESLADLASRREVIVLRGRPHEALAGRRPAVTFAPVPGWHRIAARIDLGEVHPWPWLRLPHAGSIQSYSAWRKRLD